MIDKATVDQIIDIAQSQITDVISDYVNLKKRGVNYLGYCPFHNEKTPSFTVSPQKGIFKCFGCGKGGNSVNFLMEHEQVSFVEAIKMLGKKFHIPIEEREPTKEELAQQNERESMMVVTSFASRFFSRSLFETDEGQSVGLGYFHQRGFRDEVLKKFQLGYSPEQKDALTKQALLEGYNLKYLEKTGLTIVRENYKTDRFRGRIIFPIHSLSGKVIAFGGRILKSDVKAAKYLNSPESDIYHKSRILYGIYQARQEMVRHDNTYLVEGYTDVLSFHQAGIHNVVASSGTALTVDQIRLIARFTTNITVIFDGDQAGIKASFRGIDLLLSEGMNVKVLLLPDGEDPDSFAKTLSGEKLQDFINNNESDFIKFKTTLLLEASKSDPVQRVRLIQDIVGTIAMIPDQLLRAVYVKECSKLLQVEEEVIYLELRKQIQKKQSQTRKRNISSARTMAVKSEAGDKVDDTVSVVSNPLENEEKEVIRYLLKYGDYDLGEVDLGDRKTKMKVGEYIVYELNQDELQSENPVHNLILKEYEDLKDDERALADRYFIGHFNPEVSRLTTDLIAREYQLSKIHDRYGTVKKEEDLLNILVPKVVMELKWKLVKFKIEQIRIKLRQVEEQGKSEQVVDLMREMSILQNAIKIISFNQGERTIIG